MGWQAEGAHILLTSSVAIEGTAILARELAERLQGRIDPSVLSRAAHFLTEPGISVVEAALAAREVGEDVHAMHDPTEGGLASALFELVAPRRLGARIFRERIRVFAELSHALAIDPLKLDCSGALLIAVTPQAAESVIKAVEASGLPLRSLARYVRRRRA